MDSSVTVGGTFSFVGIRGKKSYMVTVFFLNQGRLPTDNKDVIWSWEWYPFIAWWHTKNMCSRNKLIVH